MKRTTIYLDQETLTKIEELKKNSYFKLLKPTTSSIVRASVHDLYYDIKTKKL